MELTNFNFIQAQCSANKIMMEAISKLEESTKAISKSVRSAKNFSTFTFIFSVVAAAAVIAEMKTTKTETDRKIARLEDEIKELKRGD